MIKKILSKIHARSQEFIPKTVICFKEGYSRKTLFQDLFAGLSVGILAIPLSLAFAIASGVSPEKGLFTAVIAGFLISLLGGSRVQIGGPAGAFVVVVYGVVQKFGYEGLALATLLAAGLMVLMGLFRLGILLRFIPYPVTTGFTTGMAVVIFSSQIKDLFGLTTGPLPPGFVEKWRVYVENFSTANLHAFALGFFTLLILFSFRRYFPKLPGAMIAMGLATLASAAFHFPVETVGSKFGQIPNTLPIPHLPHFSLKLLYDVMPSALTIAFLGAIESLLSAVVSDGMTGNRHKSNCELVAQGLANFGSILFGGMPATGVIARTSANIKLGGKTPISGMIHAVTVLLFMIFFAPFMAKVPMAALAGVLVFVAWNMSEIPHFVEIIKHEKGDAAVLLATFIVTVCIDLSVAVQVGVVLSAIIFIKRMMDKTSVKLCKILTEENKNETEGSSERKEVFQKELPSDVSVFEIQGPFFYSVANLLDETLIQLTPKPRVFILCLDKTPLIDVTGLKAIQQFCLKCKEKGIFFLIAGASAAQIHLLKKYQLEKILGEENLFHQVESAIIYARNLKTPSVVPEKLGKTLVVSKQTT